MELLYGLPAQTAASMAETTQQVVALDPDRLAVCEYAHMPNLAKRQFLVDARKLPAAEDAFLMSQVARQILMTDGYESVGIDHFVRPEDRLITARDNGSLRRDFQGYSDSSSHALIGLGASAISRFPQGFTQNSSATSVYTKKLRAGQLASNRGYKLAGPDFVIAAMIEMLMCRFEIDIERLSETFPASINVIDRAIDGIGQVFAPFVEITAEKLSVKPAAEPLARLMSNLLDQLAGTDGSGAPELDWS
jgi:oxygen-independent coproporphyrinogen-3 oxidase